jgi:hypothetical protein
VWIQLKFKESHQKCSKRIWTWYPHPSCSKGTCGLEYGTPSLSPKELTYKAWHNIWWHVKPRCVNKAPQLEHGVSRQGGVQFILWTCNKGTINSQSWNTLTRCNMIEIKVEMTQGKQGGAKITKWGPYEWAIGWRASTRGMSGGKKLGDKSPIMGRTSIE